MDLGRRITDIAAHPRIGSKIDGLETAIPVGVRVLARAALDLSR